MSIKMINNTYVLKSSVISFDVAKLVVGVDILSDDDKKSLLEEIADCIITCYELKLFNRFKIPKYVFRNRVFECRSNYFNAVGILNYSKVDLYSTYTQYKHVGVEGKSVLLFCKILDNLYYRVPDILYNKGEISRCNLASLLACILRLSGYEISYSKS